jgi:F-type H+-transporting ATPase subunit epsilon
MTFKLSILNPRHVIYEGEAGSVYLPGDCGDFEILPMHAPIVSLLRPGRIIIDWKERIPIARGMARFDNDECVVLVEERK